MQSVFPFFPRRFWLPPSCPSKPPSVTTQALSSDMQRWRRRGYPDSPSPDVTRQGEKEESRNDARWRRGGGVCESPMADRLFLSLPTPPPPSLRTALQKSRAWRIPYIFFSRFLAISPHSHCKSPLPPCIPPPWSSHSLPCSVMQNRCDAYCAMWGFRHPSVIVT